ncbi:hypothetical protein ACN4EG_20300 [Alkalinema pantanalense CENA528]
MNWDLGRVAVALTLGNFAISKLQQRVQAPTQATAKAMTQAIA